MTALASAHHRKTFHLVILFFALAAFSADILDLREELCILSSPCSSLDSNISAGLPGHTSFKPEQIPTTSSVQEEITFYIKHFPLLPFSYRAPPFRSRIAI